MDGSRSMSLAIRRGLVVPAVLLAGCYTLQPARGVPPVGARMAFDVNDVGRVALGGVMGPEIAQVEGQVVAQDSGSYLLAVSSVRLLRGGEQVWNGESVRLKTEYLSSAYERRFSPGRSVALGVIGLGGFATFLATRSLLGLGSSEPDKPGDDSGVVPGDRLGRP